MSGTLAVTLWRSFSRGRREKHTWPSFIDTFVKQPEVVRDKRRVAGFSLASFVDNKRALPRVEEVHALILDFDNGDTTIKQAAKLLPGVRGVTYTTFRHTVEYPKLRLIFPLSRPVNADEYARVWAWVAEKIKRAKRVLDESTRDASRFWYLPSHPPGAAYEWDELDGGALDVTRALKEAPAHTRPLPVSGKPPKRAAPSKSTKRVCVDALDADQTFFGRAFLAAGMAFDPLDNGALPVVCPWARLHTSGTDGDSSTVVFPPTTEARWGLFHCSHAHCANRVTADLLDALPMEALDTARREHGRGMLRARVIDGWMQRLEAMPDFPALDRFILKCRPREGGAIFTMTVKIGSKLHVEYLDALSLPMLIGRRIDVSMEGRTVKAARLVHDIFELTKADQRARFASILKSGAVADADFDFLLALLGRNPRSEELIGRGVRRIRVREDRSGFEIVRVDGSCVGLRG